MSKNKEFLESSKEKLYKKIQQKKSRKLESQGREGDINHFYDDDVVESISEEFLDRITVLHLVGDIIRSLGGLLGRRSKLTSDEMHTKVLDKVIHDKKISRKDVACFTDISAQKGNSMTPFMNGGPMGEHWNTSPNGLYDWIDNKSTHSIIGIELGFKADEYGLEVSRHLIEKKQANPDMYVGLLIDGFVSVFVKDPDVIDDFQNKTLEMIKQMKNVGIDVRVNDSWNPLSSDFLAANHIKLWIFDGKAAFVGGIGIESQFIKTLYDQMDLIEGPFVRTLTLMSFLLMGNQRRNLIDQGDEVTQIYEMDKKTLTQKFLPEINISGDLSMEISVNVPGYVQDAQSDYHDLLLKKDVSEIFIMAPYFSDDKIARALVVASNRLEKKYTAFAKNKIKNENPHLSDSEQKSKIIKYLEDNKKVHIIFPKKQENAIIEEVSKYYAYFMRNNPVVETKQFVVQDGDRTHEMLHAKQMVVILETGEKKKYVKFGGSYNPAGRAHNMWEVNNLAYLKNLNDDDSGMENPVKDYLDDVFWKIIREYSEPFKWGDKDFKANIFELFIMKLAQVLFF